MVRKYANGNPKPHQGWDLYAEVGTNIYAIADGTIEFVRDAGAYGKQLALNFDYEGTTLFAFYAHLSAILVSQGEMIVEGQLLGMTGKSGNAGGASITPHLHFEVREIARPGTGLVHRIDPATILGYDTLTSREVDYSTQMTRANSPRFDYTSQMSVATDTRPGEVILQPVP